MAREIAYSEVLSVMRNMPVVCRESRRLHGWSRRELARRAGVATSVVTRLEETRTDVGVSLRGATLILAALLELIDEREYRP